MYLQFFHLLFVLAIISFLLSYLLKHQEEQIITSILSGICFFSLALASFNLQYLEAGVIYDLYSAGFALVLALFGFLSLIRMYLVVKMFRTDNKTGDDF